MNHKTKTAVVTGGGSGIGAAIARTLAEAGYRVVIGGRRLEKVQEVASSWTGEPKITAMQLDVADRQSVENFFKEVGPVDVLVNSAGINIPKRLMSEIAPEDWDKLIAVNATGAFNTMKQVLPGMRERKDGLIINISSTSGKRAHMLGGVAYNASKFAMAALGISTAIEYGRDNVRVTNIYPGEVETPILDNRPTPVSAEHRARILQPEDLAAAVAFVVALPRGPTSASW